MKRLTFLWLFIATATALPAYDFLTNRGLRWPDGNIPMNLQLDDTLATFPLFDGKTSWNAVAREAFNTWNAQLSRVQFTSFTGSSRGDGNYHNEVFFSSTVYGHRFGGLVLAITTAWHVGNERVEADTIFNSAIDWDSYSGSLDLDVIDLERVALHEFGHTLGLDHPNVAGQVQVAIMNSIISDLDTIATDDVRGARALYPPNVKYGLNVSTFPPGTGAVTLTPPPDTNGLYQAGTLVTLTAKPGRRFRFNFWAGDELASGARLRVRVVDNEDITAVFSTNTAPVIVSAPRSQFSSAYQTVTLRAPVRGAARGGLQWRHNGADISDATNAILVLNLSGHEDSGLYSLRATNARGTAYSKPARLVVDGY